MFQISYNKVSIDFPFRHFGKTILNEIHIFLPFPSHNQQEIKINEPIKNSRTNLAIRTNEGIFWNNLILHFPTIQSSSRF